jgi:hypothetical protein
VSRLVSPVIFFQQSVAAMSKGGFDLGDLQQGAKGLNHVQPARKASSKSDPDEEASLAQLGTHIINIVSLMQLFRGVVSDI